MFCVIGMFENYYANGFCFGSHLGDFCFGSSGWTFQLMGPLFLAKLSFLGLGLEVSIRLGLGVQLGLDLGLPETSYCANKVTFCKYAPRHPRMPFTILRVAAS